MESNTMHLIRDLIPQIYYTFKIIMKATTGYVFVVDALVCCCWGGGMEIRRLQSLWEWISALKKQRQICWRTMERGDKLHQVLESLHIYNNKIYMEIVKKIPNGVA